MFLIAEKKLNCLTSVTGSFRWDCGGLTLVGVVAIIFANFQMVYVALQIPGYKGVREYLGSLSDVRRNSPVLLEMCCLG